MEFSIKHCKVIISPLFVSFLCLILLVDKTGLMLFGLASAFIHEMGHVFFICSSNKKITKISFELGSINIDSKGMIDYIHEFIIALGGCFFNFLFFISFFVIYFYTKNELILIFSATNFGLFIFNVMPIEGLDGMDLLRIILSRKLKCHKVDFYCKIISLLFLIFLFVFIFVLFLFTNNKYFLICLLYLILILLIFSKK